MLTIETVATIEEPGRMPLKVPSSVTRGEHRVVVVIEDAARPERDARPFPDLTSFREGLGAVFHEGNTISEMREQERLIYADISLLATGKDRVKRRSPLEEAISLAELTLTAKPAAES